MIDFVNKELLEIALTHKSCLNEHPSIKESNERLEFLGDAVLEFVITEALYKSFPDKQEGYLTALRSNLVNTQNLAEIAKKIGIGEFIHLSKGEEDGGGRENPSLLADTVEAIIGALYLDQGIGKVEEFIKENLVAEIPNKVLKPLKDPKSRFQEYIQAKGLPAPKYKVLKETGPDHNRDFVIQVKVQDKVMGEGTGKSKGQAEQEAAKKALSFL
ncbi:MAG: ribonuclease III [Candidatus Woesebacteria bacterium]|nr:ribonuclease III [Candidatus Woesebacteria bacterium]